MAKSSVRFVLVDGADRRATVDLPAPANGREAMYRTEGSVAPASRSASDALELSAQHVDAADDLPEIADLELVR